MEMVQEIMPQIQKSMNVVENKVIDPNKERDQKLFDEAYTAPGDSIEIAPDRTYEHGMGTKPLLYSIEKGKMILKLHSCNQFILIGNGCTIVRDLK